MSEILVELHDPRFPPLHHKIWDWGRGSPSPHLPPSLYTRLNARLQSIRARILRRSARE